MRKNGGIIGAGSSYRRKGAAPTSSGVWSTNNLRSFEQSGRPTNEINELIFLGYYENISSDTTSSTQTFSNLDLGPPLTHGKRIIAAIGYNQGGIGAAEVGISSATLAIDSAPSQLTGTIIEASGTAGQERTAIAYWDIPASAGGSEIADININYNSAFTAAAATLQGTIIGLYYIEDETEIVQTVWNSTIRNNSLGSHAVTYAQPNGYAIAVVGHGGSSTNNTITFAGATEDFEFKPDSAQDAIFAGASKTSDTIGEATITPTPESEYGVTTVVTFGKTYDYEAVLTTSGSGYLAPTYTVTNIPSTGDGISDDQTSDFLVAIDIDNFDNTDTGVLYEIGGGGLGISIGMVSGELRVNFGDGGDTYDGVSNTGVDIERTVASTTMDNYNGFPLTLYVGLDRSNGNLRIGGQQNLRGSGFGNQFFGLVNTTVTVPTGNLQGGNAPGYGQSSGSIAAIGTSANYSGTITEIRAWNNETSLDVSRLLTLSN